MTISIIAEVGSNFRTLNDCLVSIDVAAVIGADIVKFQAFTAEALYGRVPDGWDRGLELPLEWLPKLKERADQAGIEFACTAFSPELVRAVDPFVKRHKVASSDCSWSPLLEAVWQTGKPILLSVGGATEAEIEASLFELVDRDVTLMYCEASYPARWHDLRIINLLRERFRVPVGYSDHTLDVIAAPVDARSRGARVIEKHFTALPDLDTPDRPHSLTPDQFATMVKAVKGAIPARIGPSIGEIDMVAYHKRGPDGFRRLKV